MDANKARGELPFVAGDKTYTLRWSISALAAMESLTGRSFARAMDGIKAGSVQDALALFWASLQPKHARQIVTLDDAAVLLDKAAPGALADTLVVLRGTVWALVGANQPPAAEAGEAGEANPQTAQAGTGIDSTSKPDASV